MSTQIETTSTLSVLGTLREGMRLSPAMRRGLGVTLVLAVLATTGKLIVPLAVLVGAAAALDLVIGLFARRIEDLLTQIDHARSAQT